MCREIRIAVARTERLRLVTLCSDVNSHERSAGIDCDRTNPAYSFSESNLLTKLAGERRKKLYATTHSIYRDTVVTPSPILKFYQVDARILRID